MYEHTSSSEAERPSDLTISLLNDYWSILLVQVNSKSSSRLCYIISLLLIVKYILHIVMYFLNSLDS